LRVLFSIRGGDRNHCGGDAVQLEATRLSLAELGIHSSVAYSADELGRMVHDADIVHVFHLETPATTLTAIRIATSAHKAVALSTILWDPEAHVSIVAAGFLGLQPALVLPARRIAAAGIWGLMRVAPLSLRSRLSDSVYASGMMPMARASLRAASVLLPNSRAEQEQLVALMCHEEQSETRAKCRVVVNGICADELDTGLSFDNCSWRDAVAQLKDTYPTVVLELARCDRLKNQVGLLEALWDDASVGIILAGPIGARSRYGKRVQSLADSRPGVLLLDTVPRQEVGALLRAADVHILPSWQETTGLTSLEAAACAVPTVATTRAPFDEYLGGISIPADPGRGAAISSALKQALQAPRSRWEAGSRRVRSEFTWRRAAYETACAYEWACSKSVAAGE
jgi:glycosyltransferase involved in cell wall biosynthesis